MFVMNRTPLINGTLDVEIRKMNNFEQNGKKRIGLFFDS